MSLVHKQTFCVSRVMKKIVYLISALGDHCVAINSVGKPAVGGSERSEV